MTRYKPKKDSLVEFNRKYANNDEACEEYFFQIRYPDGYICEKCGCVIDRDYNASLNLKYLVM